MSIVLQQLRNDPAMEQEYREYCVAVAGGARRAPRRRRTDSTIRARAGTAAAAAAQATRKAESARRPLGVVAG